MTDAAAVQPAPHTHGRRVPLWDNARWVAVTLVIIGHAILKLIADSDIAYAAYLFIYFFHIPVFVTVSGYFAKSGTPGVRQMKKILTDVVFPYFIFETIWSVIHWILSGTPNFDYATASWTLWYLIALAIWRLSLPYLVLLRYPLTISIIISVGAGYLSTLGDTLSLARTVTLLPFFVLGWKLRQSHITGRWLALPDRIVWRWRAGAIAVFVAVAVILTVWIGLWRDVLLRRFLLFDEQYSDFGYDQWWAGALRLGLLGVSMLMAMSLLVLMPRRKTWFTGFGQATLYIYLLHTFVLYPIRESGILSGPMPWWVLPAAVVGSVGLSVLLSLPWARRVFRPLVQPRAEWIFRRKRTTETGTIVLPPK